MKITKKNISKFVEEKLYAGIIGYEPDIKTMKCFDKPVLFFDGLKNNEIAETYWKLDANAFGGCEMAAPKYMKLDTLIMGGVPILMFLDKNDIDINLKNEYKTNLDYYPIGFMDLHFKGNNNFACSGLGIAKQYQNLGLSKYLISAGIHIANIDKLLIPTQQSNKIAIKAWNFLGTLEIISSNPFHDEKDTFIYQATNLNKLNLNKYIL